MHFVLVRRSEILCDRASPPKAGEARSWLCRLFRTPRIHIEILSRTHTSLPSQGMMRLTHTWDLGGLFYFSLYFKLPLSSPFVALEISSVYVHRSSRSGRKGLRSLSMLKILESIEFREKSRTLSQIRGQWVFSRPFSFTIAHVVRGSYSCWKFDEVENCKFCLQVFDKGRISRGRFHGGQQIKKRQDSRLLQYILQLQYLRNRIWKKIIF